MLLDSGADETLLDNEDSFLRNAYNAALDNGQGMIVISGVVMHAWFTLGDQFEPQFQKFQFQKLLKENRKLGEYVTVEKGVSCNPFDIFGIRKYLNDLSDQKSNLIGQILKKAKQILEKLCSNNSDQSAIKLLENEKKDLEQHKNSLTNHYDFVNNWFDLLNPLKNLRKLRESYDCFKRKNSLTNYRIYECRDADTYLLIPKSFVQKKGTLADLQKTTGMRVSNKSILKEMSVVQLKASVQTWGKSSLPYVGSWIDNIRKTKWDLMATVPWKKIKQIFVPNSEGWIIYLAGHGVYTAPRLQNQDDQAIQNNHCCKSIQKWCQSIKPKYFYDLMNFVPFSQIAGFAIVDHDDLLQFLGKTIKTKAFYETTCFGGCYHLKRTVETLKNLKEKNNFNPFIYICGSLSDCITYSLPSVECYNFSKFFQKLRAFCASPTVLTNLDSALSAFEDQIKIGLGVFSTPSIYGPHVGIKKCQVSDVHKEIYELRKKKVKDSCILDKQHAAVLFYDPSISSTLKLMKKDDCKKGPYFVSMIPGDAVHHCTQLEIPYTFDRFLQDSIYAFWEVNKKTFVFFSNDKKRAAVQTYNYDGSGLPTTNKDASIEFEVVILEKDKWNKRCAFFTGDCKVVGTVWCKVKNENKYYKAKVDGSFQRGVPAQIGKFKLIQPNVFKKKLKEVKTRLS